MKQEIRVPRMGESITEATIGAIMKPSGSHVKADEEILELETEKVNQVLYAPAEGILELTVQPGDKVQINQTVGTVDSEGKAPPSPPSPPPVSDSRKGKEAFVAELKNKEEPHPFNKKPEAKRVE